MKSRLVVLTMLVLGMLLSTTGAGLAVSGISGNAAQDQYVTPNGGGGVLGDQDSGAGEAPTENNGGGNAPSGGGNDVQPARQVEAGADDNNLPFTGFAAIPVLLGGIALLSAGLVLRRRTREDS